MRYREASRGRASFELGLTAGLLVLNWFLMWLSLDVGYWLTLLLAVPAAGFLVRLFLIQHDCGHGAFFPHKALNDWVGRVLGVLTLTPYDYWKRNHAVHHATSGDLDRRGVGDILTLTVDEYRSRSAISRLAYRIYRSPLVMFGIGPAYLFLLQHRLPFEQMRGGWRPWISAIATNAGIALVTGVMILLVGVWPFIAVHLPLMLIAASIGVWLFYVQHQFESVVWTRGSDWTSPEAAILGSSHYDLPGVLRWFTANIGLHHVHHLSSRIPFYRLGQVLRDHPHLRTIGRVTIRQSLSSVRLTLWDEARQRLVSFREARTS
ncbi:MAG TPA: fatty acid desaturase [Rhizomicrobium sp.]|nr:fatty acid desaturase [Rhizomicrobium sp.]